MSDLPEWISVPDCETVFQVSRRQVYRLIARRAVESRKVPIAGRRAETEVRVVSLLSALGDRVPGAVSPAVVAGGEPEAAALDQAAASLAVVSWSGPAARAGGGGLAAAALGVLPQAPALWLTLDQAADWSGIPRSVLAELCRTGRIKANKTGRGWRVHAASLALL